MGARTGKQITRHRIIAGVLVLACMITIFALSHVPGKSLPSGTGLLAPVAHFCEYLILASLCAVALTGGRLKTWQVIVLAIVIASAYGATDEFHQSFIPGRTPDPFDWAIDTLGATTGAFIATFALKKRDTPNPQP